jgi:hypothetical protein
MRLEAGLPHDRRKDFHTLAEHGLDRVPIVLDIVAWSAKHDSKPYARRRRAKRCV